MATAQDAPTVHLLVGPEELLLRRAATDIVEEQRTAHGEVDVVDVRAAELPDGRMPDLRTPSLFGDPRIVIVRDAEGLPADTTKGLLAELDGPAIDVTLVLLATGKGRLQKLAKRINDLGGLREVGPPKEWDNKGWERHVSEEFARHGRTADRSGVAAVLSHAGLDVGTIAEKVAQVCAAAPAGAVTAEAVDAVVVGHGSRGSFAVADAMCDRNPAQALELLRGVLEGGDDPVMVLGALTYRLRSLVAVAGRLDGRQVGVNVTPGQTRRLQAIRRNFGPGELTEAYARLAEADAEIKGGELLPALAIERAVVAIATRPG
jgi:DNA polymerase-3 subunit delta